MEVDVGADGLNVHTNLIVHRERVDRETLGVRHVERRRGRVGQCRLSSIARHYLHVARGRSEVPAEKRPQDKMRMQELDTMTGGSECGYASTFALRERAA